jgi:sialic acid synthase SpsE
MTAQMIQLGPYLLGRTSPPLIVAELSGNHQHSLHRVLELVETAKDCGVQAIKLQTYTPDTITLQVNREEFFIHNSNSLWKGRHLYELYEEAHLPWEWHQPIFAHCQALGLLCFSYKPLVIKLLLQKLLIMGSFNEYLQQVSLSYFPQVRLLY